MISDLDSVFCGISISGNGGDKKTDWSAYWGGPWLGSSYYHTDAAQEHSFDVPGVVCLWCKYIDFMEYLHACLLWIFLRAFEIAAFTNAHYCSV